MGTPPVISKRGNVIGRPKGLVFGPIDFEIIRRIAKEGFQTFSELRNTALSSVCRVYAWQRLKKLTLEGILNESKGDGGALLGWTLSQRWREKCNYTNIVGCNQARSPIYKTSYEHDITLRNLKGLLEKCNTIKSWTPEHVLKAQISRNRDLNSLRKIGDNDLIVPDALISFSCMERRFNAALELEISQKSRKRIVKKFEKYAVSNNFSFVFFIVKGAKETEKLRSTYITVMRNSPAILLKSQKNGMYFAELSQVMKLGLHATFVGIKDSIRFADLEH